ncbi:hypothetical protein [Maribellus sp. YY47]|uniref:hypothetical protein n=1 Tax=Maribellus sp. YY47 TaxID=2929486 RepID=UPI002000855B|nr:hypothetical protein [Maribellus sp. YY47]MCK3684299.1 hypothetical protein [Maribellus sp. YY47]
MLLEKNHRQEVFYDSLQYKANQRKLTSWLYDALITPRRPYVDKKALAMDYYNQYEGKIIASIKIQALDVFGPSCSDTTSKADTWMERTANVVHTKSNLRTIQKQLIFKVGDVLDAEKMYENERLIRQLPYIKDVRFLIDQDSIYSGFVNVTILTKDRFSFGASGGVSGTQSGDIRVYNKNIFGIGHEISVKFVGHVNKEPYLGLETFYKINNIGGKFLDLQLGYMNTFRREGFVFDLNKPLLTNEIKWGYGAHVTRLFRTDRITEDDPIIIEEPLDEGYNSFWLGRAFNLGDDHDHLTQLSVTGGIHGLRFFEDPMVEPDLSPFFANRTLYMAGLVLSQRRYIQDQLIYSYGITEDIPEGFKNEILYGYEANEFGDRHYFQFSSSNGNLLLNRKGYVYLSTGLGGYLKNNRMEECMIRGGIKFISKLSTAGKKSVRSFINVDYTLGIRRFDIDNLTLRTEEHIRGFDSRTAAGKQRLTLKLEHVVFLPHQFYKFNMAVFGFADLGIIGSNQNLIFRENYYSGIGIGLRLHNENLVFETFRLRLAFYPFHPKDVSFLGFILDEQSKQKFNSFDPSKPIPMQFE